MLPRLFVHGKDLLDRVDRTGDDLGAVLDLLRQQLLLGLVPPRSQGALDGEPGFVVATQRLVGLRFHLANKNWKTSVLEIIPMNFSWEDLLDLNKKRSTSALGMVCIIYFTLTLAMAVSSFLTSFWRAPEQLWDGGGPAAASPPIWTLFPLVAAFIAVDPAARAHDHAAAVLDRQAPPICCDRCQCACPCRACSSRNLISTIDRFSMFVIISTRVFH